MVKKLKRLAKSVAQIGPATTQVFQELKEGADELAETVPAASTKARFVSFHQNRVRRYYRTKDYWEFWDLDYWNPGPFSNRNKNNVFLAIFSSFLSLVYISIFIVIAINGKLRLTQDETTFRTVAKLHFDLCHIHLLNIFACLWLAVSTFYFTGYIRSGLIIGWLTGRALLWLNAARNFRLFLYRPYAYVIYSPSNPEWRWLYTSSHISFWVTVVYWTVLLVSWAYEWVAVTAYLYFNSLRAEITTDTVPETIHRINDSVMTTPCDPHKDYVLLQPTENIFKHTMKQKIFGHPQHMSLRDDERAKIHP